MNASGILCLSGRRNRARGFTLTDLMVVVAAVSVLAAIVVARAASVKETSGLARCTANSWGCVAGAVSMFCNDHDQTLPSPADTAPNSLWWWYKEDIKDYLGLTGPSSPSDLLLPCPG